MHTLAVTASLRLPPREVTGVSGCYGDELKCVLLCTLPCKGSMTDLTVQASEAISRQGQRQQAAVSIQPSERRNAAPAGSQAGDCVCINGLFITACVSYAR